MDEGRSIMHSDPQRGRQLMGGMICGTLCFAAFQKVSVSDEHTELSLTSRMLLRENCKAMSCS